MIKAMFLNVMFMARLDWSFLGRPLEKFGMLLSHTILQRNPLILSPNTDKSTVVS